MPRRVIMCLGRNGDLINILPMLMNMNQRGVRPMVCVSEEFQGVLDGVSYCDRIAYPGPYNDPAKGHHWLQQRFPGEAITIAQHYRHPFDKQRLTASYQTEAWRVAGEINEFGKHPLVFDRADKAESNAFAAANTMEGKDVILIAADGVSSPFNRREDLMRMLHQSFPDAWVQDISQMRAAKIFDMISVYEKSACLVSVDTVHLHLARAAKVPVVSIINDGFFGSVPPPSSVCTIRYSDPEVLEKVRQAVVTVLDAKNGHRFVVHSVHMHGETDRHKRAQATWGPAFGDESIIEHHSTDWGLIQSVDGDTRQLAPIKAILEGPKGKAISGGDVIIFQNSDISLTPGSISAMRRHAATFGAFSMRRIDVGENFTHVGRDLFGFRADWLTDRLPTIPDFFMGCPYFDLVLAAMIRKERGVISTRENMATDFYPCEMESGPATHEPHASTWACEHEHTLGANIWNRRLAIDWCKENMPSLEL